MINRISQMQSESIQTHYLDHVAKHVVIPNADISLSPSLQSSTEQNGAAYEMKFLLTEDEALKLAEGFRYILSPDPHGTDGFAAGEYSVTTVYSDTPTFDTYHRQKGYTGRKYRLRRYGQEEIVYLERKSKRGKKVKKRRISLSQQELCWLNQANCDPNWEGAWFKQQLSERRLSPILTVMYRRQAFVGDCPEGPMRLTFDRCVTGLHTRDWQVDPFHDGSKILEDQVICEFKFRGTLPTPFKAVIEAQRLSPTSVSKYRLCLAATGVIANESGGNA